MTWGRNHSLSYTKDSCRVRFYPNYPTSLKPPRARETLSEFNMARIIYLKLRDDMHFEPELHFLSNIGRDHVL